MECSVAGVTVAIGGDVLQGYPPRITVPASIDWSVELGACLMERTEGSKNPILPNTPRKKALASDLPMERISEGDWVGDVRQARRMSDS